jgi:hypothetical protein
LGEVMVNLFDEREGTQTEENPPCGSEWLGGSLQVPEGDEASRQAEMALPSSST